MTINLTPLEPYVVGEKPDPLQYQFQDGTGVPIDLTNYAVKFNVRERDAVAGASLAGALDVAADGLVEYVWTGAEFATPGHYLMEFWVGNGNQRYDSELITADVRGAVGQVPQI